MEMKTLLLSVFILTSSQLMAKNEVFECKGISVKENKLTLPDEAAKKLSLTKNTPPSHEPVMHSCQSNKTGKDHYGFKIDVTKNHVIIYQQSNKAKFGPLIYLIE